MEHTHCPIVPPLRYSSTPLVDAMVQVGILVQLEMYVIIHIKLLNMYVLYVIVPL